MTYLSETIDRFGRDYLLLNSYLFESSVGKWSFDVDKNDNQLLDSNNNPCMIWQPNDDLELFNDHVGLKIDKMNQFDHLLSEFFTNQIHFEQIDKFIFLFHLILINQS